MTDESENPNNGERHSADEPPAGSAATHEYVWRCTGCKAIYDERPEQCEHCGATEFTEYREL